MKQFIEFASSTQGANHIKADKVCQDASGSYADGLMSIAVVADGHGSDNYPRTQKGSAFAVNAAIGAIREFVEAAEQAKIDVCAEQEGRFHDLTLNILKRWHESVNCDLTANPFQEAELGKVSDSYKKRYTSGVRCEKAYGTTLIAVCATSDYWFGLHIGDGKCVAVDQQGECFEPIPWDDNCQANITTSICDSDAGDEFRFFCGREFPLGVFIGSDGVDDSYAGDGELHDLYRTVLCLFAEQGETVGKNEIRDFLPGISKNGSGDDVSMAGLIRAAIAPESLAWVAARKEYETALRELQRWDKEAAVAEERFAYIQDAINKSGRPLPNGAARLTQADALRDQAASKREQAERRVGQAEAQLEKLRSARKESKTESSDEASGEEADPAGGRAPKKRPARRKLKTSAKGRTWKKRKERKRQYPPRGRSPWK